MKPRSKKFVRPVITPFGEDADSAGVARIFAEVDAGAGPGVHVTVDLKITVHPRHARGFAGAVRELETSSAELSDERLPDQQPDAVGDGSYIIGLFGNANTSEQTQDQTAKIGTSQIGATSVWTAADGLADRRQIVMAGRRGLPHPGGCRARGGCDVAFVVVHTIRGIRGRDRVIQLSP
jgi:hypothetical protein